MIPLACRVLGDNPDTWVMGSVLAFPTPDTAIVWYGADLPMQSVPLDRIRITTNEICAALPVDRHGPRGLSDRKLQYVV